MAIIETIVLYKDNENVVVNADSEMEAQLKAEGWSDLPVVVSKPKPKSRAKTTKSKGSIKKE